jgi:uncharacterized protein YggE
MKRTTVPMKKWHLFVIAAMLMAISVSGCAGGAAAPVSSQGYLDTITTTGHGEAYGKPDMAQVQFGYSAVDTSIGAALDASNAAVERIKQAMLQMGIAEEDIQTTNFSVWPEEQYDPMTGQPSGERKYRVENTIQVIIREIGKVADVIEAGLDNGANNVYGLTFSIDDTSEIAKQARSAAVADARQRAEQLASEIGATLGQARMVTEVSGYNASPVMRTAVEMAVVSAGAPPISEGQLVLTIEVNVTYDIQR